MSATSSNWPQAPTILDRRQLLRIAGASTGALLFTRLLPGCQSPSGSLPTTPVGGINVADLKVDSLRVLPSNVVIGRDSSGLYAMSAICTHQGCIVEDNAETIAAGLNCPCHGSAFDGNGDVTRGPARSPLQHFTVTVAANGDITIDPTKPVAAAVRVPVS